MNARIAVVRRYWDGFVGPEATVVNHAVTAGTTLIGALAAPAVTRLSRSSTTADEVVSAALAMDLWGGAYVNNTRACARWYERPGQTDADHLRFTALHVHPAVVAWLDRGNGGKVPSWAWAGAHYGFLMAATLFIRRFPDVRRLLGVVLTAAGIALDGALGRSKAAPWFAFTYYPKLLLGHASAALWSDEALDKAGGTE